MKFWLAAIVFTFCSTVAWGHDAMITKCNPHLKGLKLLKEEPYGNSGLYAEGYDRNADGRVDIVVLSPVKHATDHADVATFYIVDLDLDGKPDVVFIDKTGLGNCDDVVPYEGGKFSPMGKGAGL